MDDPREKCDECKHRSVSLCPGTQRQIIARYKAAWDACYACARAALSDKANLERLIVKAGPSIAAIAKSYHLYPDFVQTIRPLIAASARIAKRKAAARLARQGKP